jgi:hypothetical protein
MVSVLLISTLINSQYDWRLMILVPPILILISHPREWRLMILVDAMRAVIDYIRSTDIGIV